MDETSVERISENQGEDEDSSPDTVVTVGAKRTTSPIRQVPGG